MKIILFGNRINLLSGHSRPVYYLAKEFINQGHEVTLITNVFGTPLERVRHKQVVETEKLGEIKIVGAFEKITDLIFLRKKLKKIIREEMKDAEIIHFQDFTSLSLLSRLFKGVFPCPTVCSLSGLPKIKIEDFKKAGPTAIIRFFHNPLFIRNFLTPKFLSKREFSRPDRVIVSSKLLSEVLEKKYGIDKNRITVVYPPIQAKEEKKREDKKKVKTFLYYGWGSAIRGLQDIAPAFEEVYKARKGVKLVIASAAHDPERNLLIWWIRRKYRYLPIVIKKFVPDINSLIDSVDFLVFPFRSTYGYAQPPLVVLESMARRKPIISTYLGAIPEIIKNNKNGILVKPADTKGLAQKMLFLVDNPLLAQRLGENALAYVKKQHNPEKIADQTLDLYKKLIKERKHKNIFGQYWAKKEYSRKESIEEYDEKRFSSFGGQLFDQMEKEVLVKTTPKDKKTKILEVGTGTGRFAIFLAKKGYKVLATDISKGMLKKAKEKAEKENVSDKIEFKTADIYKLPYKNNSFDFVYAIRVINQLFNNKDKEKAIKELFRVTRPGGILLFDIINEKSLAFFKRPIGLITIGEVKEVVKNSRGEVFEVEGKMILSQTILEKTPFKLVRFVSRVDNFICRFLPFFATRVYFKNKKERV